MEDSTIVKRDYENLKEDVKMYDHKCAQGYNDLVKKGTVKRYGSLSGLVVQVGDKVIISRTKDGETQPNLTFELVEIHGSFDPRNPKICIDSPIGREVITKKIGECFTYDCPTGKFDARIETIISPEKENLNVQSLIKK